MEWTDKHRPESWEDLLGDDNNLDFIRNFFWSWSIGSPFSNAILLAGEEGCGKTSVAEVAAKEHSFELISINASEARDMKSYENIRLSSRLGSWDNETKCILIDECDGLGRRFDGRYGGKGRADATAWGQIEKMIESGTTPVVLCCNYSENIPWRMRNNRNILVLEMTNKMIKRQDLFNRLMKIATAEGYQPSIEGVKKIATVCPTIRSCIKTLQICCMNDEWEEIHPRDIDGSEETRIFKMLKGQATEPPIKDTYRLMNFGLVNNVGHEELYKMNRLSLIRRSVPAFSMHEHYAVVGLVNKELQTLVKPKWVSREKQNIAKREQTQKKKEESKRKAMRKKIEAEKEKKEKQAAKKKSKSKPQATEAEADWGDLF